MKKLREKRTNEEMKEKLNLFGKTKAKYHENIVNKYENPSLFQGYFNRLFSVFYCRFSLGYVICFTTQNYANFFKLRKHSSANMPENPLFCLFRSKKRPFVDKKRLLSLIEPFR